MLPASESFDRHDLGGPHVDHGLVEHGHLRAFDSVLQIHFELDVRTGASFGHAVELVGVATERLRPVHRCVRIREQLVVGLAVTGCHGHPDRP